MKDVAKEIKKQSKKPQLKVELINWAWFDFKTNVTRPQSTFASNNDIYSYDFVQSDQLCNEGCCDGDKNVIKKAVA